MNTDIKIEEYRQRVHSLSSTGIDEDALLDAPHFDLELLEKESEDFLAKATKRINQLNVSSSMGILKWLNQWKSKRKVDRIQLKFQSIVPKLQSTADDVKLWIQTLEERKLATMRQGEMLRENMGGMLDISERNLDFYDELNNDCRQINYDVTKELAELKAAIAFNAEMAHLYQSQMKKVSNISRKISRSEASRSQSGKKKCNDIITNILSQEKCDKSLRKTPSFHPHESDLAVSGLPCISSPQDSLNAYVADECGSSISSNASCCAANISLEQSDYSVSFEDGQIPFADIADPTNEAVREVEAENDGSVPGVNNSVPFLAPMSPAVWHGYRSRLRDTNPGGSSSPLLGPPSSRSPLPVAMQPFLSKASFLGDLTLLTADSNSEGHIASLEEGINDNSLHLMQQDFPKDDNDVANHFGVAPDEVAEQAERGPLGPAGSTGDEIGVSVSVSTNPHLPRVLEKDDGPGSHTRIDNRSERVFAVESCELSKSDGVDSAQTKPSKSKGKKKSSSSSRHSREDSKGCKESIKVAGVDRDEWQGSEAKRQSLQSKSVSLQSILQGQAQGQGGHSNNTIITTTTTTTTTTGEEILSLLHPGSVGANHSGATGGATSLNCGLGGSISGKANGVIDAVADDGFIHVDLSPHAFKANGPTSITSSCSGGRAGTSCHGQNCSSHCTGSSSSSSSAGSASTGSQQRRQNSRDSGKLSRSSSCASDFAVLQKQYGSDPLLETDELHKQLISRIEHCEAVKGTVPTILNAVKVARDLELQSIKRAKKLRSDLDFICSGGAADSARSHFGSSEFSNRAGAGGPGPSLLLSPTVSRRYSRDSTISSPEDSDELASSDVQSPDSNDKKQTKSRNRLFSKDGDFGAGLLSLLSGSKEKIAGSETNQGARKSFGSSSSTFGYGSNRLSAGSQLSQSPSVPSSSSENHLKTKRNSSHDHGPTLATSHHHHYSHHSHSHHNHQNHYSHHNHHSHHSHTISFQHLQQLSIHSSQPMELHGLDLSLLRTLSGSNLTPATESVCSASGSQSSGGNSIGDVQSDSSSMHVVMECVDDLMILLDEEAKARGKMAIISALLDSASEIGTQLSKLEKSPSV